jgi:mannose/fructose-specific phosphotransferase system component IIA
MKTISTFIIAHEDFAAAILQTVEKVVGPQGGVFTFSNQQDALPVLLQKILARIKEQQAEKVVAFIDLKGGSCWNLAGMLRQQYPQLTAIAGVNLPMLISYFNYRDELAFDDLINKAILDGGKGIARLEV